jgi:hypothetical protein
MSDALTTAARAISRAKMSDHFRAAIGQTLTEISEAYKIATLLPSASAYGPKQAKTELDRDRIELETAYKKVEGKGSIAVTAKLAESIRNTLRRAWGTVTSIRAATDHQASWSGASILADAIVDAPKVVLSAVKATVETTGSVAGSLVGSILKGFWPLLLAALVALFLISGAKRKGLL